VGKAGRILAPQVFSAQIIMLTIVTEQLIDESLGDRWREVLCSL